MTQGFLAAVRLANQRIDGGKFETPENAVRWMGALQAQDYHQSLWAIGLRVKRSTAAQIEQAIAGRKIVRTWPLRGTIHFVPAEDAKWMLRLSAARTLPKAKRRQEQLELEPGTLARCINLMYGALSGSKRLSRSEMMKLLEDDGIATRDQRGYHILWYAAQSGHICSGPMQGKEQTFVLLDEWVPVSRKLAPEEALAELAGRFFASRGPATIHDFAWWAGITVADARRGLEAARQGLASEVIGGETYWLPKDARDSAAHGSDVFLLPGFDEYLLGYKDRSAVLAAEHAPSIVPGGNGIFLPTIVDSGQIAGSWKRKLTKHRVELTLNPFVKPDRWTERVAGAAAAFGEFIGLPVQTRLADGSGAQ